MVNYIGIGGANSIGATKSIQDTKGKDKVAAGQGPQFSASLQAAESAKTSESSLTDRAEKIASLKAQIASGAYQPDTEKVSSSLLKFLVESR